MQGGCRIVRLVTTLLVSVVLIGCNRTGSTKMLVWIGLDSSHPGVVKIKLKISEPSAEKVQLQFYLPDELMHRAMWKCGPGLLQATTRSEPHLDKAVILHFTAFEFAP